MLEEQSEIHQDEPARLSELGEACDHANHPGRTAEQGSQALGPDPQAYVA